MPLVIMCFLGLFLRLYRVNARELWFDEEQTFFIITTRLFNPHSGLSFLGYLKNLDSHPPLYYLVLFFWCKAWGATLAAMRYFSVLVNTVSLPLVYLLARRFCRKEGALFAVAMMVLSPFHLWYAQEARMYSFIALAGLLSTIFFCAAVRRQRWGWWGG